MISTIDDNAAGWPAMTGDPGLASPAGWPADRAWVTPPAPPPPPPAPPGPVPGAWVTPEPSPYGSWPPPMPPRPYAPTPPNPYGAFATVDGLGGVAAPLLAGFALTLLALVLQTDQLLRWPDPVLVLHSLAFVLFLQVVQLNARAKGYAVTPTQVQEWYADADTPTRQEQIARELHHHQQCWHALVTRARNRYNLGIIALLIGAALMLVPRDPAPLSGLRVTALVVLCAGVVLEVLEVAGDRLISRRVAARGKPAGPLTRVLGWLVPVDLPVPPPPSGPGTSR